MKSNILNVLDLEQSCYEDGKFPDGERQEIIEIGLTTVNLARRSIIQSLSLPIIPTMSSISPYCTGLTGWTEAKLRRQGMPFGEALRRLTKYGAKNRLLVTDSDDELETIAEQCRLMALDCPFGGGYLNVSTMVAVLTGKLGNLSLEEKLKLLGLEFAGTPHRGKDDSLNIARLILAVVEKASFPIAGKEPS